MEQNATRLKDAEPDSGQNLSVTGAEPRPRISPDAEPTFRLDGRYEVMQIVTNGLMLVVTAMATIFAFSALNEQRIINRNQAEMNRSQLELNTLEKERAQRRYASRVALWSDDSIPLHSDPNDMTDVYVSRLQNRATVPLTSVYLAVDLGTGTKFHQIGDIRPCSITTIRLGIEGGDTDGYRTGQNIGDPAVYFNDVVGSWLMDRSGLRPQPLPQDVTSLVDRRIEVSAKPGEATDCGSD
ncbi:hypothetical protein AB0G04_06770 [Actinoplanes sp. NPDC023801]|uniref:hypothetical protein n=1 Tax=Actinoplanes sp. NPDC023801 TaxID=3154595 RepID=UPI0033F56B92